MKYRFMSVAVTLAGLCNVSSAQSQVATFDCERAGAFERTSMNQPKVHDQTAQTAYITAMTNALANAEIVMADRYGSNTVQASELKAECGKAQTQALIAQTSTQNR
jgi:hypothetical protein